MQGTDLKYIHLDYTMTECLFGILCLCRQVWSLVIILFRQMECGISLNKNFMGILEQEILFMELIKIKMPLNMAFLFF